MSEENKQLLHRWFEEVWNKGRADAIEEMFAEDGIAHGLADETGAPLRGPASFREFHQKFRGAFPDIVVTVDDALAEGDKVAARCTVRAVHAGDHLGFEATQKPMEISGMTMAQRRQDCRSLEQLRLHEHAPPTRRALNAEGKGLLHCFIGSLIQCINEAMKQSSLFLLFF